MRPSISLGVVVALLLPAGAGADEPQPLWQATQALGPTDSPTLAARGTTVIAAGRPALKDADRVVPSPRVPGLFRSADEGRSWSLGLEPVAGEDGQETLRPISRTPDLLGMTPSGTDAYAVFAAEVWRSDDDGLVWRPVGTLPSAPSAMATLMDGRPVVGLVSGGLRVSGDRGATWSAFGGGLPSSRVNDVLPLSGSVVLAATDGGLYRSADAGTTFSQVTLGLASPSAAALAVAGEDGMGQFLAMAASAGTVMYSSSDLGAAWLARPSPAWQNLLPVVSRGALELAFETSIGFHALYSGTNQGLFVAGLGVGGGPGPVVSTPGLAWVRLEPQPGGRSVQALARGVISSGEARRDVVYAGVRRASPYVAGFATRAGFASPAWYDELDLGRVCGGLVVHRDGSLYVACGRHLFRSRDGGTTFEGVDEGLPYPTAGLADNGYGPLEVSVDGRLWVSGFADGLWRSAPGGAGGEWMKTDYPGASVAVIEAHPTASGVLYASGTTTNSTGRYVLWRTLDTGHTWHPSPEVGDNITSISVAPNGRVLVSSSGDGVSFSMNDGAGWARVDLPPDTYQAVFSPGSSSLAWAVSGAGPERSLHRSDDGGLTWRPAGEMPAGTLTAGTGETLYVNDHSSGFHISRDGGVTWEPYTEGLPVGFGSVRSSLVADPTHPGRAYTTAGWISSSTAPQSMWVYRAQDPGLAG